MPTVSNALFFLTGTVSGAAIKWLYDVTSGSSAQYLGDKYTDERRRKESDRGTRNRFKELAARMPGLFEEIRKDLAEPGAAFIREVLVYPFGDLFESAQPQFTYRDKDIPGVRQQFDLLCEAGFAIMLESNASTARFRMTEPFVDLLLAT